MTTLPVIRDVAIQTAHQPTAGMVTSVPQIINEAGFIRLPQELTEASLPFNKYADLAATLVTEYYVLRASGKPNEGMITQLMQTLKDDGIDVADDRQLQTVLRDLVQDPINKDGIECVYGDRLLAAILAHKTSLIPYLGGVNLPNHAARDYIQWMFDSHDLTSTVNGVFNARATTIENFFPGDQVVAWSPWAPNGHMFFVTEKGIDLSGIPYIKIFDLNYNNDGQARLLTITANDNLAALIAHLPSDTKPSAEILQIGLMRSFDAEKLIKETSVAGKGN